MSTASFDSTSVLPSTRRICEKEQKSLPAKSEELSGLWLAILLTARWEAQETDSQERREDLQAELDQLRLQYYGVIDEIAMNFGVPQAMAMLQAVERNVRLPQEIKRKRVKVHFEPEPEIDAGEMDEEDSATL
jgi:hypothetical protein